ncbi:branched-chain alpha-ketoacid dehydrogenase [Polychytrium aggregatum]|uniref:branched-chain alpha-ketoacid dehydrogenase n=1 Tax=Polychytrium aggregatum TaxID=110093 RepID=UPI0022FDDBCF|nr:branched-chain alpha-ketoacid dehydrogenase [Polychytrium aggregatum]KAI9197469.1 branched-chain alpha-ketoacid dehydrogenase [Polychytrium aggregatum]
MNSLPKALRTFSSESAAWHVGKKIGLVGKEPTTPVTLQHLIKLGQAKDKLASAQFLYEELPRRLARRVMAIQKLPFIVGVNPYIKSIYNLYSHSFETLQKIPKPVDEPTLNVYSEQLRELVDSHQDVIPNLAKGFLECGKYMDKQSVTEFLDGMIKARIGIRVLAEHHLAMTETHHNWVGVIDTKLSPSILIRSVAHRVSDICEINYGTAPEVELKGHTSTTFSYLHVHLEYILMELLKNSMRATVEHSMKLRRREQPPVEITICEGKDDIHIRIRDQGGGISSEDLPKVFDYSFTTVPKINEDEGIFETQARLAMQSGVGGPIAGLGFGLPMSRIYAKYFGGCLELIPVAGHGCDVFLTLPNISGAASAQNVKI